MIGRVLALLALGASIGLVQPDPDAAAPRPAFSEPATAFDRDDRLHGAIETALQANLPGMAGQHWRLHALERAAAGPGEPAFIVANGVLATPGGPDTHVRLTGRFDPVAGQLRGVSYRLQPSATDARQEPVGAGPGWNVQAAVNHAFTQVEPDERIAFALDSAEATRVEGGGRRFVGTGIGTWNAGEARHVAFTLTLSAAGELVAFDYSTAEGGSPLGPVDYVDDALTAAR